MLLAGFAAVFTLFQVVATALDSNRGEQGLVVCAVVFAALVAVEMVVFRRSVVAALATLGLGAPARTGMLAGTAISAMLLATIPVYALAAGDPPILLTGWALLLPGLFAQGGLAEEALFRAYLFGHIRVGRHFWRAAFLATIPFALAHLYLFFTMPWPLALASLVLSVAIGFPLARLYDLGGNTIWAPALVHFIVQGAVKLVLFGPEGAFPLVWIAASAVLPFAVFLVPQPGKAAA